MLWSCSCNTLWQLLPLILHLLARFSFSRLKFDIKFLLIYIFEFIDFTLVMYVWFTSHDIFIYFCRCITVALSLSPITSLTVSPLCRSFSSSIVFGTGIDLLVISLFAFSLSSVAVASISWEAFSISRQYGIHKYPPSDSTLLTASYKTRYSASVTNVIAATKSFNKQNMPNTDITILF